MVSFKAPHASTSGMRQFRFETPEPGHSKAPKAAFPEGAYEFFGRTTSSKKLIGKSTLNHGLPATATFATQDVMANWSRLWSPGAVGGRPPEVPAPPGAPHDASPLTPKDRSSKLNALT